MVIAIQVGEQFARSPYFIIDGEKIYNPCTDEVPAAPCVVDFLKNYDVDAVITDNIGGDSEQLLEREDIEIRKA